MPYPPMLFFAQRIPSLRLQFEFLVVACYEHLSEFRTCDVSNQLHVVHLLNLLVVADWHGEEQFVILAAVEGARRNVHVQLLRHHRRLIVDWDILLVDAAAAV